MTEAELQAILGLVVDEKSADKAVDELVKHVYSKLKDGYIKVPAKLEFGEVNKKEYKESFEKAQLEFQKAWNSLSKEMSKEGFFGDDKAKRRARQKLNVFTNSYHNLNDLVGKTQKKNGGQWNKNSEGVRRGKGSLAALNDILQEHKNYKKMVSDKLEEIIQEQAEIEAQQKAFEAQQKAYTNKTKSERKKSGKAKGPANTIRYTGGKNKEKLEAVRRNIARKNAAIAQALEDEQVADAIAKHEALARSEKDRQMVGLKSITRQMGDDELTNSEYVGKNTLVDAGRTTSKRVLDSAWRGEYDSALERYMAASKKDFYNKFGNKITYKKLGVLSTDRAVEEANTRGLNVKRQVVDKKPNGQIDVSYKDDVYYGRKKKDLIDAQLASGKSQSVLPLVSKTLRQLDKGKSDATLEKIFQIVESIRRYNETAGKNELDTQLSVVDGIFNKFYGNKGYFELNMDEVDENGKVDRSKAKDFLINESEEVIKAVKLLFASFENQFKDMNIADALQASADKWYGKTYGISPEDDPKNRNRYGRGVSQATREMDRLVGAEKVDQMVKDATETLNNKLSLVQNAVTDAVQPIVRNTKQTATTVDKQFLNDKVSQAAEGVLDKQEVTTAEANKAINETGNKQGFNTEKKAARVIDATESIKEMTKEQLGIPQSKTGAVLDATSNEIFNEIAQTTSNIYAYTKALFGCVFGMSQKITEKGSKMASEKIYNDGYKAGKKDEKAKKTEEPVQSPRKRMFKVKRAIPMGSGGGPLNVPNVLEKNPRNLPDYYRYMEDGKLKTSGVIDRSYSDNLPELTPYKEPSAKTKRDIRLSRTEEFYRQAVIKQLKQELRANKKQTEADEALTKKKRLLQKTLTDHEKTQAKIKEMNERHIKEQKQRDEIERRTVKGQVGKVEEPSESTEQKTGFAKVQEKIKEILTRPMSEAARIMDLSESDRSREYAERMKTFGEANGRNASDTGAIAGIRYIKSLWRGKDVVDKNDTLFQDVKLTEGIGDIDTTKILNSMKTAIQDNMFDAQTGGGFLKNLLGSMTFYIGQDSLEKSRAKADGLNQIMSDLRQEIQDTLFKAKGKENVLREMEASGDIKFDSNGKPLYATKEARKVFTDMENLKSILNSLLAEAGNVDEVIRSSHGNINKILKNLGFVTPELMKENAIIQNINSGLDKNGKALKFQKRTAEILNYTFQLMSRHIGQMVKNWMLQLNPITQIKKAFQDFMSYSPKWQRTMNVVKYNLRDIILPIMEKIAQLLVNMIGFADIILQKIQAAFGNKPISLFDQENAKKVKEEYEEMYDISAGFDELHDVGSSASENNPDNLMGEIYKPKLSQAWIDLANQIGDLFAGIITGDLGFSEVMLKILKIAWDGIKTLWGQIIWPFIKGTIWPAIKKNWLEILAWVLGAFLVWKGLSVMGELLWKALFGKITSGAVGGLFSKVGTWIMGGLKSIGTGLWNLLGLSTFGQQMQVGFLQAFQGQGLIGAIKGGGASLGSVFAQAFIGVVGVAIAGLSYAKGFDMAADDSSYNIGLEQAGGDEKDKKGSGGAYAVSGIGGAAGGALVGLALGGPLGAAIGAGVGAIVGLITTSLAPAFEELEVAARNANNEMQKIEYYQGAVQGYTTQVQGLDEMAKILTETLRLQTEKVYEEGEQLGITKQRMDELVGAVQNGTFHTDMLSGSELGLKDSLIQLDAQQEKNKTATEKLEAAKRKLQKAEIELAIAEDIAAGNFEMAAARVEYAVAAELMDVEEGTKKMVQITKEGSAEQAAAILRDLSPDLQKKFQEEYGVVEKSLDELVDMYYGYSKDERKYFLQNLTGEVQDEMEERIDAIERAVKSAPWYKQLLDFNNDGKIFGKSYIDVPGYATGTNYVPSDGLAYLHKGEAVIPAKYNEGVGIQGKAYREQAVVNNQLINAVARLEATMKQGITVNGQFVQRGSDLVAVVNRTKSQTGADVLSNVAYAR